jgi:hypothetical protein
VGHGEDMLEMRDARVTGPRSEIDHISKGEKGAAPEPFNGVTELVEFIITLPGKAGGNLVEREFWGRPDLGHLLQSNCGRRCVNA